MMIRKKNIPRIHGHNYLFLMQVLDRLRAGQTITAVTREYDCTRQWIYLLMKTAGIDPQDFRWYRRNLLPPARAVATLLTSKHLKVRALGRTRLRVLELGRTPINIAVHTASIPRAAGAKSRTLYYHINVTRKGVVHVVPLDWGTLVILKDTPQYVYAPNRNTGPVRWNYIVINDMLDIDILDVLRENVRV